ncbi:MAG: NUDIX hydrolase [Clostridia bacterium]|nr:NUDIX hydrolase [Clostridia bacterium]
MKIIDKIIFNESKLKDEEIDEEVVRVKAFIINNKNEILVAMSNGGVQLIGGHVEDGEQQVDTVKREILEEAGINISKEDVSEPFFEVSHYIKNYFNTSKNVISNVFYFLIRTDDMPNIFNTNLTEEEKGHNFKLKYISCKEFKPFLEKYLNNEKEINRCIAKETLAAFEVLINKIV